MNREQLILSPTTLFLQQFFALKTCRSHLSQVCDRMRNFAVNTVSDDSLRRLKLLNYLGHSGYWSDIWEGCGDIPINDSDSEFETTAETAIIRDSQFFVKTETKIMGTWRKCNNLKSLNDAAVRQTVIGYPKYLSLLGVIDFGTHTLLEIRPASWCVKLLKSFSEHSNILTQLETKVIEEAICKLKIDFITRVDGEKLTRKIAKILPRRVKSGRNSKSA